PGSPPPRSGPGVPRSRIGLPTSLKTATASRSIGGWPPRSSSACRQNPGGAQWRRERRGRSSQRPPTPRARFSPAHVEAVYSEPTSGFTRFIRVEDLVYAAAEALPGLAPSRAQVAREANEKQSDKDGLEIDQGLFLSHVLGHERAGRHLCHAMLLP